MAKDRTGKEHSQPANVRSTLKHFKDYASAGGRIRTSDPEYARRLKALQDGILREMKKTKSTTPRNLFPTRKK